MPYGLKSATIQQIHQVFSHFPQIKEAILYGSRAKGNSKPGSDIDITLMGDGLDLKVLSRLSDELDELFLPYIFDISIYQHISNKDFLDHIKRVGVVFYQR